MGFLSRTIYGYQSKDLIDLSRNRGMYLHACSNGRRISLRIPELADFPCGRSRLFGARRFLLGSFVFARLT